MRTLLYLFYILLPDGDFLSHFVLSRRGTIISNDYFVLDVDEYVTFENGMIEDLIYLEPPASNRDDILATE